MIALKSQIEENIGMNLEGNKLGFAKDRFLRQNKTNNISCIKCPDCNKMFGIDNIFMLDVSEINYKYRCPYCSSEHSIFEE